VSKPWQADNDDGIPPFNRKATLWLERVIRAKLQDPATQSRYGFSAEDIDFVVGYLRVPSDFAEYVHWVDENEYRGRRYSNGAWTINWDAVQKYLRHAGTQALRAKTKYVDDQRITSLEQWLREDVAGTLMYPGSEGGSSDLPGEVRRSLRAAAVERERGRVREKRCPCCGHYFVAKRRNGVRCPDCIERAKGFERGRAAPWEDLSNEGPGGAP
jgi:hypothetical protein